MKVPVGPQMKDPVLGKLYSCFVLLLRLLITTLHAVSLRKLSAMLIIVQKKAFQSYLMSIFIFLKCVLICLGVFSKPFSRFFVFVVK